MRVAAGVDLERAGDEVGGLRQHVAVVADARDLAGLLHLEEHVFQNPALFMRPFQRLRKADFVERAVALGLELAEDPFAERERFHASFLHAVNGRGDETLHLKTRPLYPVPAAASPGSIWLRKVS